MEFIGSFFKVLKSLKISVNSLNLDGEVNLELNNFLRKNPLASFSIWYLFPDNLDRNINFILGEGKVIEIMM